MFVDYIFLFIMFVCGFGCLLICVKLLGIMVYVLLLLCVVKMCRVNGCVSKVLLMMIGMVERWMSFCLI